MERKITKINIENLKCKLVIKQSHSLCGMTKSKPKKKKKIQFICTIIYDPGVSTRNSNDLIPNAQNLEWVKISTQASKPAYKIQ